MSKPIIFTKAFWMDAADRVVSTAAQSVLAVVAVDQVAPNAFTLDYQTLGGVAAGGAMLALLKLLGKQALTAQVPATEVIVRPPTPLEIEEYIQSSGGDVERRAPRVNPAPMPMVETIEHMPAH
jgi:hypothetical protein